MKIIDELCTCGHLQSEHNATEYGIEGHGDCKNCDCAKYTWKKFVLEDEDQN